MRKREKKDQPTWSGIKAYVEGSLHRERRRTEAIVANISDSLWTRVEVRLVNLNDQVELVAREVSRHQDILDAAGELKKTKAE